MNSIRANKIRRRWLAAQKISGILSGLGILFCFVFEYIILTDRRYDFPTNANKYSIELKDKKRFLPSLEFELYKLEPFIFIFPMALLAVCTVVLGSRSESSKNQD